MNKEQQLLIALLENASKSKIESLFAEKFDWNSFTQTARNHRLVSFIFPKLNRISAAIPPQIYRDWQRRAEKVTLRNLNLNARMIRLVELFETNNIEYLSYKGATLAQIAYGDSSLRQFGDLDFLIYKKDFPKVKKIIVEDGGTPDWELSEKQERAVLKRYYEYPFIFGENAVSVEIHWAFMELFFGFDYNIKEVFRRSRTVSVHGKTIRTLSNEDLLIVLCVHGSKHFWKRLSWICDVGKLVQNQKIEWDKVFKLAKQNGCLRMLKLGLFLSRDFLRFDLPVEIENDLGIESLAVRLKNQLFDDTFSAEEIRTDIHLKMRERWRDKFTYSQRLFRTKLVDSLFLPMGRPQ